MLHRDRLTENDVIAENQIFVSEISQTGDANPAGLTMLSSYADVECIFFCFNPLTAALLDYVTSYNVSVRVFCLCVC